ncbi:MAG: formylglycine-generating enzyme family protein [Bullifex sp.]
MKKEQLPEVEPVRLPVLYGMRPGKYILILLITAVLLAFFLIGVLPGILKGGRYISFETSYSDVGIIIDGEYIGSSEGSRIFIESGEHTACYIKNGDVIYTENITVDHPVLLTLLFKRTGKITPELPQNPAFYEKTLEETYELLPVYSQVIDPPSSFRQKPLFTNLAKDAAAASVDDVSEEFFILLNFVTTDELKSDLDNALQILEENDIAYRSTEFDSLYASIPSIFGSGYDMRVKTEEPKEITPVRNGEFFRYEGGSFTIGDTSYPNVSGISTLPYTTEVAPFEISASYVSEYDWALFMEANPYWAKDNIEQLVADGMTDGYYLAGIFPSVSLRSSLPIRNISWYAADAYTKWLSEKEGAEYRLPTEAEYEMMAASAKDKPYGTTLVVLDNDTSTPKGVKGCLWEYTSTSYVPLARFSGFYDELSSLPFPDAVIKGGSYINNSASVSAATVGVIDRSATSEYAGFRVARTL